MDQDVRLFAGQSGMAAIAATAWATFSSKPMAWTISASISTCQPSASM
jgi:hypothetical protein